MTDRHYYSSQAFRVFYASLSNGLKTRIEKTEDAIKKLKTDANVINTKYLNSTGANGENAAKKAQKIAALIATLEELNAEQRRALAVMIRSQEPATAEPADYYEGLL